MKGLLIIICMILLVTLLLLTQARADVNANQIQALTEVIRQGERNILMSQQDIARERLMILGAKVAISQIEQQVAKDANIILDQPGAVVEEDSQEVNPTAEEFQ